MRFKNLKSLLTLAIIPILSAGAFAEEKQKDASGNDPRDFGDKFMPYYRTMELENGAEINSFTMFGFKAFNGRFGMTYELPLAQQQDWTGYDGPALPVPDPINPVGQKDTGVGDLGLRFFLRPEQWEFTYKDGTKNFSFMPVVEFQLPTASDDLAINEADTFVVSPGIVLVFDMPFESPPLGLGFVAMMNFYDFDAHKDTGASDVSRYRGRWFWQQPLSKPAFVDRPGDKSFHVFDLTGLYLMPEFQPVYDFETDDFSLWIGPELGKVLREGTIVYMKPGWGIDNSEYGDREFTFEVGFRYFL